MTATKAALRARILARRSAIAEADRARAAAAVHARLLDLPALRGARAVLGYAAFGSELDLDPWLTHLLGRGVGVFLPWVDGADLGIARVRDLDADLAAGWRGVREPRAAGRRPARPDRLEAVVAPGVAFDAGGRRLGYGGGHFDRLLARLPRHITVVGVAFDEQVVDAVPVEAHDRPVDAVVTPSAAISAPRRMAQ